MYCSIEDTPKFHDMSVFSWCSETHNVLLTIECWEDALFDMLKFVNNAKTMLLKDKAVF